MANLIRVGQKWRGIVVKSRGMSCKTKPLKYAVAGTSGDYDAKIKISLGDDFGPVHLFEKLFLTPSKWQYGTCPE